MKACNEVFFIKTYTKYVDLGKTVYWEERCFKWKLIQTHDILIQFANKWKYDFKSTTARYQQETRRKYVNYEIDASWDIPLDANIQPRFWATRNQGLWPAGVLVVR